MSLSDQYVREGHPAVEELMAERNVLFPRDPRDLLGNFWPEEESVDEFIRALRDWRRHVQDRARG